MCVYCANFNLQYKTLPYLNHSTEVSLVHVEQCMCICIGSLSFFLIFPLFLSLSFFLSLYHFSCFKPSSSCITTSTCALQGVVAVERLSAFNVGAVRAVTGGEFISSLSLECPRSCLGELRDIEPTTIDHKRLHAYIMYTIIYAVCFK